MEVCFLVFVSILKRSFIIIVPRCISYTLFSSLFLFSNMNALPLSTRAFFYHVYFLTFRMDIYFFDFTGSYGSGDVGGMYSSGFSGGDYVSRNSDVSCLTFY